MRVGVWTTLAPRCPWFSFDSMSGPKLNSYFHYLVYSSQNPVWWLLYLGPSLCAQGGFSHQMAVFRREPWFKFFLSAPIPCCLKWACDLWATFPPNPVHMEPQVALLKSPLPVVARALHSVEEIDKLIALSAALLLSRDAWLLLLQGNFHVCLLFPSNVTRGTNGSNIIWSSPARSPGEI